MSSIENYNLDNLNLNANEKKETIFYVKANENVLCIKI